MATLDVRLDRDRVGALIHDPGIHQYAFEYGAAWRADPRGFPISPWVPLDARTQTPEFHSAQVRQFFENLLPEGEALDHAAGVARVSKSNLVGLMAAIGRETAGALRVTVAGHQEHDGPTAESLRLLTPDELSARIRERPSMPFSVWDGKVRLSIAGYQDKIAVLERDSSGSRHW